MKTSALALITVLTTASAESLRQGERQALSFVVEEPPPEEISIFVPPGGGGGGGGGSGDSCTCQSNYDCNKPVCNFNPYTGVGTCGAGPGGPTGPSPTPAPVDVGGGCCEDPQTIPTECEVTILINLLNIALSAEHRLAAQCVRLSFHDAGTFNVGTNEGGANGCLMTDPDMRLQPENGFLDLPINTLEAIKNSWQNHPDTCVSISAADMIQFAGHVAALRQVEPLGIDATKISELMQFEWGRSDETDCDINWADNLPGFSLGTDPGNLPLRCLHAGSEIKEKMMERNGFTAEESAALIGAHTIGLTRNSFGTGLAAPWVDNGRDDATLDGPVFDNGFHDFLQNTVTANNAVDFASDITPFDQVFPDWLRDSVGDINHLDTDIVLAFPSQDLSVHPDFHTFTAAFSADNDLFLSKFFEAFQKMAQLGVSDILSTPGPCLPCAGDGTIAVQDVISLVSDLGAAKAAADDSLLQIQKTEEFTSERELASTPLKEEEILDAETALKEVEAIQKATSTSDKEDILSADVSKEEALMAEKKELEQTKEAEVRAEMSQKKELAAKQRDSGRK